MRRNEWSSSVTAVGLVLVVLLITQIRASYGCLQPERQALLNFKRSLNFYGDTAPLPSWEGDGDCCEWEGITCDNLTRHILTLHLNDPCSTTFTTEYNIQLRSGRYFRNCPLTYAYTLEDVTEYLSQIQHLTYLDLSRFQIDGVPVFLGSMQRLRYLSLRGGSAISSRSIGNLTNLRALYLQYNTLSNVTASTWLAPLSSLQYLGLYGVDLSKPQPHHDHLFKVLNTLPSLLHLQLVHCGLGNMLSLPHSDPIFHLTNLTRLQLLNLATNELGQDSPVLHAFRNITSIKALDIAGNNLYSVPPWLAKLHNLVKLDLSWNSIEVLDPLRNLTSIKHLQLSDNRNLTTLPLWFTQFDNLQVLSLSVCGFSGQLPLTLENMTSIRSLDLRGNSLSSIVPLWLGKFENLVELYLSYNLLYGPVPHALCNLTSLTFLDFSQNNLSQLPSCLGDLKSLVYLDISYNNFTTVEEGFLSSILSNLCHLKEVHLSHSNGQGIAFKNNGTLSGCNSYALRSLYLEGNEFGGILPNWLGRFKNLKYLFLTSNSFSGPIPFSIGNLTKLKVLHLEGNILNGSVPHSLVQLLNLQELYLSSNHFSGVISQHFGQLKNLQWLDLSSNYFRGFIPQSLSQLNHLYFLDLSSNYLQATMNELINSWPQLLNLSYLDLSHNQIIGSIPESLPDKMPNLLSLVLHDNHINGSLPSSLGKLETLYSFDVSNNNLSGKIPSTLWNLSSLGWLHLNNNKFQGKLPSSLANIKELALLDVGENQLSGTIPSWNGSEFPNLQIIRMRRNMLNGSIPSTFCQLVRLQILDLAENNLVGPIPHCIGNITRLTSPYIPKSSGLDNQDLKQVIKGRELDYIKNLKYVVNLDLSNNSLSGSVPSEISSLSGLIGLNLSYNNLSGPIPDENQFQSLNDPSSYAGNQYLCGAPLPKLCLGDGPHPVPNIEGNEDEDGENEKLEKVLFYFVIFLGFGTGFWGIIGVLYFKKNWRYVCFGYADKVADRIYVAVVLKKIKVKEMMQRKQ
ncbi:hypothetical protein PIB30_029339 [Stylosanthes scabra]|uniref:Leucine-rich repeat-containing N-terminal plant-type domain-containing protein n=1 Tax=Stylosanthes scabra TaxID=79078 RepID=A0ABU6RBK3_9FABA|nr:hypothetical protein [Stylosanthes scabra]